MLNNVLIKRFDKNTKYIILINIIIIVLYKIGAALAEKRELLYRGWVENLYMINVFIFFLLIVELTIRFVFTILYSKIKSNTVKDTIHILELITIVVSIGVVFYFGLFIFVLSYNSDEIIYRYNKKVISRRDHFNIKNPTVYLYEPVNIFFMKKLNT